MIYLDIDGALLDYDNGGVADGAVEQRWNGCN